MRALVPKILGVPLPRDADHKSEAPAKPGLDPRNGILDDDRSRRLDPQ